MPATLTLANYPAPVQDCRDTPYGTSCELLPSDAAGSGGPASLAYAAYARQDYQEAITQARKAAQQDPGSKDLQRLLTTTLAAGNAAQMAEANQRMSEALAAQPDDPTLLMQRGYLHQRMRQPRGAARLPAARATGKAPPTAILDEGYALSGVGDKRGAVDRLKEAIDQDDAGKLDLTRSSASIPAAASPACRASGAATSRPATGARGRPRPAWAARPSRCPATRCSARPRSSGVPPIS